MTLAYRAAPLNQAAGATVTGQGALAGDLIIIFAIDVNEASKSITCAGFTSQVTASNGDSVAVLTKVAGASEPGTYTLATTGSTASLRSVIITIAGGAVVGPE